LAQILAQFVPEVVSKALDHALAPLKAENADLRMHINGLRDENEVLRRSIGLLRDNVERSGFRGVWRREEQYAAGSLVICDGVLWGCAASPSSEKPGGPGAWRKLRVDSRER
jgi:hypothetical protein